MTPENGFLLEKIGSFARGADDIRFLALIGSSADEGDSNDEFSDIDLVMVTDDVARYFNGDAWLSRIGEVWVTFTESAPGINYWERRCVFKNGLDVDFIIVDKYKLMSGNDRFPVLADVCRKTMKALVDKDRLRSRFDGLAAEKKTYAPPTREEFGNAVGDFYFHCVWALKKCLRGEYWVALQCVNGYLKSRTLAMLEWYEHSLHGSDYDTRYGGRYLERWVEEPLKGGLTDIFSAYGKDAIINALAANEALFGKIAKETAERNGFEFPSGKIDSLTKWVKEKS